MQAQYAISQFQQVEEKGGHLNLQSWTTYYYHELSRHARNFPTYVTRENALLIFPVPPP